MERSLQKGFTRIGVMMVLEPVYQDYTVRAEITEAVIAGSMAKGLASEGFQSGNTTGLQASARAINATPFAQKSSKYVLNSCVFNAAAGGVPPVAAARTPFAPSTTNGVISAAVAATVASAKYWPSAFR